MARAESIVLGGGCFWCLEAAYQQVEGVLEVVPGYSGGTVPKPSYEMVTTGLTGHVEVVRVRFDTEIVTLQEILAVFWIIHDPTTLNRQGADVGPQYASVIFYGDEVQHQAVLASVHEAQARLNDPVVTRIERLKDFYEAEEYHHNYFLNHPEAGYCRAVIEPKLRKLRHHFSSVLQR